MAPGRKGKCWQVSSLYQVADHTESLEKHSCPVMGHVAQVKNAAGSHWAGPRSFKYIRAFISSSEYFRSCLLVLEMMYLFRKATRQASFALTDSYLLSNQACLS